MPLRLVLNFRSCSTKDAARSCSTKTAKTAVTRTAAKSQDRHAIIIMLNSTYISHIYMSTYMSRKAGP